MTGRITQQQYQLLDKLRRASKNFPDKDHRFFVMRDDGYEYEIRYYATKQGAKEYYDLFVYKEKALKNKFKKSKDDDDRVTWGMVEEFDYDIDSQKKTASEQEEDD